MALPTFMSVWTLFAAHFPAHTRALSASWNGPPRLSSSPVLDVLGLSPLTVLSLLGVLRNLPFLCRLPCLLRRLLFLLRLRLRLRLRLPTSLNYKRPVLAAFLVRLHVSLVLSVRGHLFFFWFVCVFLALFIVIFWPFTFTPDLLDPVFGTVFVLSAALPFLFTVVFYDEKKEATPFSTFIFEKNNFFLRLFFAHLHRLFLHYCALFFYLYMCFYVVFSPSLKKLKGAM